MHELSCPSCSSPSIYDLRDYLLMCQFCSSTFKMDLETGQKEIFGDHFIIPTVIDALGARELVTEWLKRLHHQPGAVEREFIISDIKGASIPYWLVSLEAHTLWKGMVRKHRKSPLDDLPGADYIVESGKFRRNYRWAVSGRSNLFEQWGMTRLHQPHEDIQVDWDGFPLDSTFTRGRMAATEDPKQPYTVRERFDFKYQNGLPILGIQIGEEEALRRANLHVDLYHMQLAKLHVDHLVDYRTEMEIAGVQLVHVPFWHISYVFKPTNALRYFHKPMERNVIIDGYGKGVMKGELAIIRNDKVWVNSIVCAAATVILLFFGLAWHPAFYLVAFFCAVVAAVSAYFASLHQAKGGSTVPWKGADDKAQVAA